MRSRTRRTLRHHWVAAVAAVALGPLLATTPAAAGANAATNVQPATTVQPVAAFTSTLATRRTVSREGVCRQGAADWDLKVRRYAGGRLYVEFEVDDIPRGFRWQLFVADNGRRVAAVTRRSLGPALGVQVARLTANRAGRDRFRAAAVNPRTGNTCVARLRY
jgi:hypothetical protein